MRLQPPRLRAREPAELDAKAPLVVDIAAKAARLIGVGCDGEGAIGAELDGNAGDGLELGGEAGPAVKALAGERRQRALVGLGLNTGCQHAGRRPAGAVAGAVALENIDRCARLRETPADAEPDDARADDCGFGSARRGN